MKLSLVDKVNRTSCHQLQGDRTTLIGPVIYKLISTLMDLCNHNLCVQIG